jgi:heme/copper-type cytochrome/quinol oxidase subunit 3
VPGWGALNFAETIGAFLMAWRADAAVEHPPEPRGTERARQPWNVDAQWATSSPPPPGTSLPPAADQLPPTAVGRAAQRPAVGCATAADVKRTGECRWSASARSSFDRRFWRADRDIPEYRTHTVGFGAQDLDVPRAFFFSLFLFASSLTIYLAEQRLHRDDERGFLLLWLLTMLLGVIFLANQVLEYLRLYAEGVTISTNLFTTAFYTLTGFHGLHVVVGLIALGIIAGLARAGDFRGGRRRVAVDTVAVYWHFVDAVWVVVFSLVYLLGRVA